LLAVASDLERKNGWTPAGYAGEAAPDGMRRLLNAAVWDEDKVQDALGRYVARHLGDLQAVLIADETGCRHCRPRLVLDPSEISSWRLTSSAAEAVMLGLSAQAPSPRFTYGFFVWVFSFFSFRR
jgi:hypothetical protein